MIFTDKTSRLILLKRCQQSSRCLMCRQHFFLTLKAEINSEAVEQSVASKVKRSTTSVIHFSSFSTRWIHVFMKCIYLK